MKNSFVRILIISIISFLMTYMAYAVPERQALPVSTSYDDLIQSAKESSLTSDMAENPTKGDVEVKGNSQYLTDNNVAQSESLDGYAQSQIKNVNEKNLKKIKTKPHRSFANTVFKFILAMIWVAISSIIIFIILISYKKLILKGKPIKPTYESTEESLDTPKNFKEAIKLFLDKTKWN